MSSWACLAGALLAALPQHGRVPRTPEDALLRIPGLYGRVVPVGDVDGDGLVEVVAERGGERRSARRLELVSLASGEVLERLWASTGRFVWDVIGDADGDGVDDVVVGEPADAPVAVPVVLVSGHDGAVLQRVVDGAAGERFGATVAGLGDVDGDGRADFAVGAPAFDPWRQRPLFDGRRIRLASARRGWVSCRSGADGSELWRREGEVYGHGFALELAALGDLDGDGTRDLAALYDGRSEEPAVLLSGADGTLLRKLHHGSRHVRPAGDVDGDGLADVAVGGDLGDPFFGSVHVDVYSGARLEPLLTLRFPSVFSESGRVFGLGDVDGDGVGDLGVGDPDFDLGDADGRQPLDLARMSLVDALVLQSGPSYRGTCGCALVYSGRTRRPVLGVFGAPGSTAGLGAHMAAIPDVDGDGRRDLLITSAGTAYVFASPLADP